MLPNTKASYEYYQLTYGALKWKRPVNFNSERKKDLSDPQGRDSL